MNSGTRQPTDTAVILLLPAASATPYRHNNNPVSKSDRPGFSWLHLSHQARRHWLDEAETQALLARELVTLHISPEPPAWFRACPQALDNRLAAWRSDRLVQRALCCDDMAEALLAAHWLQQGAAADSLDARIADIQPRRLQRMRWQRSALPGLWTFQTDRDRRLLRARTLRHRLAAEHNGLCVALHDDGGYWLPGIDDAGPTRLQGGHSCRLQLTA